MIMLWLGRFPEACEALEQALPLYDPTRTSIFSKQFDPYVQAANHLGVVLTFMGYSKQGQLAHRRALQRAETLHQPATLGEAKNLAILSGLLLGMNVNELVESLHSLSLSQQHNMVHFEAIALIYQAIPVMRRGEFESAIAAGLEGVARYRACQSKVGIPFYMTYMIDGCRRAGQFEQGFELLQQARVEMDETGADSFRSGLCGYREN
jgi:hypothetical protein